MNDFAKIFIQRHRVALDWARPEPNGWKRLEKTLERFKTADGLERKILLNRALMDSAEPPECVWANVLAGLEGHNAPADGLECFIRQNREALDAGMPDLRVWGNIARQVPGAKPAARRVALHWPQHLRRVAAALALLVAGIGIGMFYAQTSNTGDMAMGELSSEYKELEQYYQRNIAVKQEQLARFTGNRPAEVTEDLAQLDRMMGELRQELANVPPGNREQVVRAMIENYKAKTSILERVLERLEDSKMPASDHDEAGANIKNI
jgi:hypothetical protein